MYSTVQLDFVGPEVGSDGITAVHGGNPGDNMVCVRHDALVGFCAARGLDVRAARCCRRRREKY